MIPAACPCGGKKLNGKCDLCGRGRGQHQRTSGQRGYDYAWQQFRLRVLAERPLCQDCEAEGKVTEAVEVHHVEKIKHAPHRRLDQTNVLALCESCHAQRTGRGE